MANPENGTPLAGADAVDGKHLESLGIDDAQVKEQLTRDYDSRFPHDVRGPERSGPPAIRPHPHVSNPIIAPSDIPIGTNPSLVADPHPFEKPDEPWLNYLFFEMGDDNGEHILVAESPDGAKNWTNYRFVLEASGGHYANPWVETVDGTPYLVPDRGASGDFEIYSLDPTNLASSTLEETPLTGVGADPQPFWVDNQDRWYMLVTETTGTIALYVADKGRSLTGRSWSKVGTRSDAHAEKMGGHIQVERDGIYVPYQWDNNGKHMTRYKITELTPTSWNQQEVATSPLAAPTGRGWNESDMHHYAPYMGSVGGKDLVYVDGRGAGTGYAIGLYTHSETEPSPAVALLSADQTGLSGASDFSSVHFINFDTRYKDVGYNWDTGRGSYTTQSAGLYHIEGRILVKGLPSSDIQIETRILNQDSQAKSSPWKRVEVSAAEARAEIELDRPLLIPEGEEIRFQIRHDDGSNNIDIATDGSYVYVEKKW
jgi:hypothetical protein